MSGLMVTHEATGYTLVRGAAGDLRRGACDLLLSDAGVLYAAGDGCSGWRCLGLADPEELLDDLGMLDGTAAGLVAEDVPPRLFMPTMM